MLYPSPLKPGSRVAITAFSSGVPSEIHKRLDLVLDHLRSRGYEVVEGSCLRSDEFHVSADKYARAQELEAFLLDDSIDAVIPPWGGELAIELLPLLDFSKISKAKPKWVFGYSDVTTITAPLAIKCGWVTAHCSNLMDLVANQTDPITSQTLDRLSLAHAETFTQFSSGKYQTQFIPFEKDVNAPLNLTEETCWKYFGEEDGSTIEIEGRLIGGCLDTQMHLFGTEYLNLGQFKEANNNEPLILFIENVELSPTDLARVLFSLSFKGVFEHISGLLIGRNSAKNLDGAGYTDQMALKTALHDVPCPVIYDVDIGHRPPNLVLLNGAWATVRYSEGKGAIEQTIGS